MMVDLGKAKVFEGHMAQARHRIIGRKFSLAYLLEKFAYGFGVHSTQHSAERSLD